MVMKKIIQRIEKSHTIAITSHISPDGDSIGSLLALYSALKNMGKEVFAVVDDKIPSTFKFLKGSDEILLPSSLKDKKIDSFFFLDCGDRYRAGTDILELAKKATTSINIDHHLSNDFYADLNLVDADASATGELVYKLLQNMGCEITPHIATALYTAIITDTGSFKYENTTSDTLRVAADLLDYGVDIKEVRINIWESKSISSIKCLSKVLDTLQLDDSGKIAWIVVTNDILEETGVQISELDGIIGYPKELRGVEVAIFFKELPNGDIKVGFRSKNFIDVSELAVQFSGGGHKRAAGCTLKGPLNKVIDEVVKKTKEFYQISIKNQNSI